MKIEEIEIHNDRGDRLGGRLYSPGATPRGGVIFCHGLFSSKDAYKIVNLAADIVRSEFTLLTFDFSFISGMPESFREFSIMREVQDLQSAVSYLLERGLTHLHLIGSSMGGVISLLYAASRPEPLRSLTLIATPADLAGLIGRLSGGIDVSGLSEGGTTVIDGVPIGNGFFREALGLDMDAAVRSVAVPTLVIHGARDGVVDVNNTEFLRNALTVERSIVLIPDGDHNLTRDGDLRLFKAEIPAWIASHNHGCIGAERR
ncbi:MAG TPA: alpha/beta fold hydrolase [Spirochaetota bacterium]|jgi:putative redox protein|nr:MAG: putative aminoacrylate hydrolase RutD [Spirochaetes bacterium ADurb.BinA120]HPI12973.1 alpha/beta fold hydrolase [Spirochaetota bacterium]HPO45781.1 alpha/beta fold hydrolase [Spirochaetota bacterium]